MKREFFEKNSAVDLNKIIWNNFDDNIQASISTNVSVPMDIDYRVPVHIAIRKKCR